jgi:prolyl-tRNA synthetase
MKYSHLFGKTLKETPKDAALVSHRLLHQAGYIRESTAGRYYLLPLGWRVHQKIQQIIKEEMDLSGAQEVITPVMHPKQLWLETNRADSVGFELMTVKDRSDNEFVLGGTAEEMFVDLLRKFQISYQDLPINLYQFSTKFRDEKRARGGLLRLREFVMKDAYSFHTTEDDFKKEYAKMKETYQRIFNRLGLPTVVVAADNGYIGGEYCHEFVVEAEAGESKYFTDIDGNNAIHEDLVRRADWAGDEKALVAKKGIEVGNIFQLGYHYSSQMAGATFTAEDGTKKPYYMGCYGIGLARAIATIVEKHHDENGIIWPESITPYQVHLVGLNQTTAGAVYDQLTQAGIEVLYDDREVRAGEKFADADLVGIPIRLVVSDKTGEQIEWKRRTSTETELINIQEVLARLNS